MENEINHQNPLAFEPIGKLIGKFAVPAVISSLVSAIYNIVDQIFIGQSIGPLGNAATNVAFPLVMIMAALSMTYGVGGASNFSLYLGQGRKQEARGIIGNSLMLLIVSGLLLGICILLFVQPLMTAFGARGHVLDYAVEYTGITAFGLPFAILGSGGTQLIRADGSPRYAMISSLSGAILNTILDPIFIFGFHWGMRGAALATIIGQIVSGLLILSYFRKFQSVKLEAADFKLHKNYLSRIFALGAAAGANQLAVTCVQIVMNNTLGHYGELSLYGRDIPLACVGVITKVNVIFSAAIMGIAQSCQPIIGYNYGAKNFLRVKETYKKAALIVSCISVTAFLCFQLFPQQIVSIFGRGDALYFEFAIKYFRIFMFCTFLNGIQILSANFFPSIGKGTTGMITSMSRQVLFLLPLVIIFPLIWGIGGVLYAGPIADGAAGTLAIVLVAKELKKMEPIKKPTHHQLSA